MFVRGVAITAEVVIVSGTVWAFVAARRRALIGSMTVCVAFSTWAVLSGLIMLDWWLHPSRTLPSGVLAISLAALVVAPLAAAPLALAWNRNR